MIEEIVYDNIKYGIIVRANYDKDGIEFFTKDSDFQQLGYMKRPENYIIEPHLHNNLIREVSLTQEVLFLKSGKLRVDFYNIDQIYMFSKILLKGDIILLSYGGHGFKMLEQCEIIEVKQGPYIGIDDKVRFNKVDENLIIYK